MAIKKYLSLDRLTEYDALIKQEIADAVSDKASSSHNHDSRYYTETEIDNKIATVNTSISNITNGTTKVAQSTHADSADSATTATTASSATKATQDGNGKVISSTYETKTDASSKLSEAKAYADSVGATVKNDLLNGAGTAYDTLKELGDLIVDNQDAIDALEEIASGKADASHTHTVANITDLTATATEINYMDGVTSNVQAQLDGKAATSHTHSTATTSAAGFMTADMVTKLNGIATGANKTTTDSSLSTSSTNPVQNKVVATAINSATSAISANTSSISTHSTAIANLQTAVGEIQEITSAEIQALFA